MQKRSLTSYSDYFTIKIPNSIAQILIIIAIGAFAGTVAALITHPGLMARPYSAVGLGGSSGILAISFPALLTVLVLRIVKRKMKTKHALFAVLAVSLAYSIFIMADAAIYHVTGSSALAYVILILANASLFGYWFIINRVAVGQKRAAILTAEIQPILNLLVYFPFGDYLLRLDVPLETALVKLYSGMFIFLLMGYVILYLLDRPAKKNLSVSSVDLFSVMVGHWLYDITSDTKVLGNGGVKRDVSIDIASLYADNKLKAVFVKPDIHYGPFGSIGGSVFTESLGSMVVSRFPGASPFMLHGAVNIEDNPMNTSDVRNMSRKICDSIASGRRAQAYGYVKYGKDGPCRAVNVRINDLNLLTLSKAPLVTEDIDRQVGLDFEAIANRNASRTMLIDAHNSRFESAGEGELRGIYRGSPYIGRYGRAISEATRPGRKTRMWFGASCVKLSRIAPNPDLGPGYTSLGVFGFGKRRFAMLYFDANNMLPGFRGSVIAHIKKKYGIDCEVYSTDTHAVNSIAKSAMNSLGRYTRLNEVLTAIDSMMDAALKGMVPVRMSHKTIRIEGFKVWGKGSEELLNKVGLDIIRTGKRVVPLVRVSAYIIAAWIIYII